MTSKQAKFLKTIYFRIFQNNQKQAALMRNNCEDHDEAVRNSQRITCSRILEAELNKIADDFVIYCEE